MVYYSLMKKYLLTYLLFSTPFIFGETWECKIENERDEYNKLEYVRDSVSFRLFSNGIPEGIDSIIEENDKEIVLYFNNGLESFITILNKDFKTIVTYGSTGKNPNNDLPPGFGNCNIIE